MSSSSSPLPIRRAGPNDTLSRSAKDALVVTPSGHLYGSTPGGTRIVYSREQLLSLASSPLSKTPPNIPPEISRSIEKSSQLGHGQAPLPRSNGSHANDHFIRGALDKASHSPVVQKYASGQQNGSAVIARSPPINSSRSPGSALNFGNGSMSSNGMSHSTSFKERLAAAQMQQQRQNGHSSPQRMPKLSHSGSDGNEPTSSNGKVGSDGANGTGHGEEQFSMEM